MGKKFEVQGSTDNPVIGNLLESSRYRFKVLEIEGFVSKVKDDGIKRTGGNFCMRVTILVDGWKKLTDNSLVMVAKLDWKYRQFLFAIGIRQAIGKGQTSFTVDEDEIIGKEGLVDIVKDEKRIENIIRGYYPLDQEVAPIKDVPSEPLTEEQEQKEITEGKDIARAKEPEPEQDDGWDGV